MNTVDVSELSNRVSELSNRINQRLDNPRQPETTSSPCIYKIPELLRKVNEAAYTPRLVSIGPYHYGNEDLEMMENVKDRYLRNYLERMVRTSEVRIPEDRMRDCIKDLSDFTVKSEGKLKSYYAEKVTMSDASFLDMILLDGVFIIELILQMTDADPDPDNRDDDVTFLQFIDLINDLFFTLENQLPWFFIEGLYNKHVIQHVQDRKSLLDLALSICSQLVPSCSLDKSTAEVKHLHDLLRKIIIHPLQSAQQSSSETDVSDAKNASCLPCAPQQSLSATDAYWLLQAPQRLSATVLHEAGVKFKVRKSKSFLDITFDKGALNMPSFKFNRNTETFVRNLMAYEQCHDQDNTYLCDYFHFMDSLINTSKDVDLLVKSKIIINWLGDNDEVATLVNNLFKHVQIGVNRFHYDTLCADLDGHCKKRWNNWKITLKRDHLSTPWKAASTVAAIILLLLTLIQTVCSLITLFN